MSHTQEAAHGDTGPARITDDHHLAGPHGEDEIEATGDRRRRFNTFWWVLLWLIVIVLAIYPGPWW